MNENMDKMALNEEIIDENKVTDADDFFYEENELGDNEDIEIIDVPEVQEETPQMDIPVSPVEVKMDMRLSDQELNKMLEEDEETAEKSLDDSYVLSNFDVLFDSLYNDVAGANNFISNLIEQKKTVNVNEAELNEMKEKLIKEKEDYDRYIQAQKDALDLQKQEVNEYVRNQRIRIQNEEQKFTADCDATRADISLAEQSLKIANEKLDTEKEQFGQYKSLEEEKIRTDHVKLDTEKEQFAKEKAMAEEKIRNSQKELQTQKEQFAKSKELEEKKLELESKNLSQSCARFKELVSQFNSGFQQLPGKE